VKNWLIQILQPHPSHRIAGHAPVTAWGKAHRADFGAVGKAGAFELLGEETAVEDAEPFLNDDIQVNTFEGTIGHPADFAGLETETEYLVEEKVVELVGADQIFGFLGNEAVVGGR